MKKAENKGSRSRFYDKTGIAKHREWRGLEDTAYDYVSWLKNVAVMGGFMAKSPLRIAKGLFEYRWFASYLASFHLIDNCTEGLRGPALRTSHIHMNAIMKGSTQYIAEMMQADRRFGENKYADKIVLLEQTMPPEILAGFPNLKPAILEVFQGLLGCFMDQNLSPFYIDLIEGYGLPSDSCRLSANAVGVSINDDFPKIGKCAIVNNMPCDSSTMNSQLIERRLEVPAKVGSIPMRWDEPGTDKFAIEQVRSIIKFIEEQTGEKFDWNAFCKVIEICNKENENELERWNYYASPYIAYAGSIQALYRVFFYTFSNGRLPACSEADRKALKIMEDAYTNKINCFPKTRHRAIAWAAGPSFYPGLAQWMYNCWGILQVVNMETFIGYDQISTESEDEAFLGIAKLYEKSIMRRHLTGGYDHLLEFWEMGKKFDCDMVIMYDDFTCKGAMGLTGMINDQAKDQPFSFMWVQHDLFDHRTVTRREVRQQINDYMFTVMKEEPLDASLLDFDDSEGW